MEELKEFQRYLMENEKELLTQRTYVRVVQRMLEEPDYDLSKQWMLNYRNKLKDKYSMTTVNNYLAAISQYLNYKGVDWKMKFLRIQKKVYIESEKELTLDDYRRLVEVSKRDDRLNLVIQTLCSTGIRISELHYLKIEIIHQGRVQIMCKGKVRIVLLSDLLIQKLEEYCRKNHIVSGEIFITKSGKPWNRSNIWRSMKKAAEKADIEKTKVYPHNLRHLFAKVYYAQQHDLLTLADILGHSNIETTRLYLMTNGAQHRSQINSLGLVK